ncbi:hypothetical protein FHG87_014238 [Trinorchestia longiramus]|nr:hypothetical protein FHG87_014238 [Trinorchestia longiramus]
MSNSVWLWGRIQTFCSQGSEANLTLSWCACSYSGEGGGGGEGGVGEGGVGGGEGGGGEGGGGGGEGGCSLV